MIRKLVRYGALAAVVGLGACEDQLVVENPNNPETRRVLATPADAEALLASYYKRWHDGLYRGIGNIHGMANVMSFQNYSSLANECQGQRTPMSGAFNGNAPGNQCQNNQQRVYFVETEVARVATSILQQLNSGAVTLGDSARNTRARAFGEFLRGMSMGYVALFYDSAAIVSEDLASDDAGPLYGYVQVMDSALAALQRAIDYASLTAPGSGFPLPGNWIPSPTSYTGGATGEFVKMVRSHRARLRASVGRTPAERAAANWTAIRDDAAAGITANHLVSLDPTTGPFYSWHSNYSGGGLWHQMPPFFIGMGDGAGGYYNAWIGTPLGNRGAGNVGFFMDSPDLRFPQGADRPSQQADFNKTSCENSGVVCKRYFMNRPSGNDQFAGNGWGNSNYDWVRYNAFARGIGGVAFKGDLPFFTLSENRLLQAEGEYRLGNYAAAAALIDFSRTAGMAGTPAVATGGGLPGLVANGVTNATATVPGGAACVPKVPVAPFTSVACGNLWEALKYEKRIETAYTHFAAWYLDNRGWGDLALDVPLFWAVPYQDLLVRGYALSAIYGAGAGPGNAAGSAAALSNYGW